MIRDDESICPCCGGFLKYYDQVRRIIQTKGRKSSYVKIRRMKCVMCNSVHRELPSYIFPYKRYEAEMITGVLDGFITSTTLGYEDYPCEATMLRWKTQAEQQNSKF